MKLYNVNLILEDELITSSRIEDSLFLNTPVRGENRIDVSSSGSSLQEATRTEEDLAASSLAEDVSSSAPRLDQVFSTSRLDQGMFTYIIILWKEILI